MLTKQTSFCRVFYKYTTGNVQRNVLLGYFERILCPFVKNNSTSCPELLPKDLNDKVTTHKTIKELPQFKLAEQYEREINQYFIYAKNRRMRYQKSLIMLEGKRQIQDALDAKLAPKIILFNRPQLVDDFDLPAQCYNAFNTPLYKARYDYIQMWSDLTTSPGLIGLFDMPVVLKNTTPIGAAPVTIVCDNVREPGNLGTILRIAASIPVSKVIVAKGCVDLWDTKVIRSSCGSHFRMPISYGISWEQINDENEGSVLLADCSWFSEYENESKKRKPNKFVDDNNNSDHAVSTSSALPVVPYHCVHYNKLSPAILVIGGETEGLSNESIDFASKRNGIRVNIPLSNYVDSLNSGVALGVILFEIKRNLLTSANQ